MVTKAKTDIYVAKLDMTMAGAKVNKGQLIQPRGNLHEQKIFGEATHWTHRWHNTSEPVLCDTDGCTAQFDCEANLFRHRKLAHAPDRDEREQRRIQQAQAVAEREAEGETIGGFEIEKVKKGPHGGDVPYIKYPGT